MLLSLSTYIHWVLLRTICEVEHDRRYGADRRMTGGRSIEHEPLISTASQDEDHPSSTFMTTILRLGYIFIVILNAIELHNSSDHLLNLLTILSSL